MPNSVTLCADNLVAHRGWQRRYPENTLLAVDKAIGAGARHVEIDVQFSGDGRAVVFHDPDLFRKCGDPREVYSLTLNELITVKISAADRLGSNETDTVISSLEDVALLVSDYPEVTLYVEIKKEILEHFANTTVLDELERSLACCFDQIILISFDYGILHEAAALGWRVGPVLEQWQDLHDAALMPANSSCVFLDYKIVPPGTTLHDAPFPCVLYEIDEPQLARDWLGKGATKIETFAIGEMLASEVTTG
ncbi:glycerophosphoryl diester phosphodiesterase [Litorivivens lipolytica]|uniref:Glycerophosphoryl diester phosphodiesterase n=1 Tax=Litorivivens lipolytica TaxID=1524264 RepID=A0A7W4W516_9GAMM|nr:glycerophosphodiester phosphodiesterase family protein [Litorivivens lipolytica]MBB3047572.1 glycerophosphoryl diester phosphodiesterase [Litorivivens lipolytica]